MKDVLIYDIETDSKNPEEANLKWFGAYSFKENKFYIFDFVNEEFAFEQIETLFKNHKIISGHNIKAFDNPITERAGFDLKYKTSVDTLEMSAPKGNSEYNKNFKNKLILMGIEIDKFSLKNIIKVLKLDNTNKGDIDYNIFKKDKWTKEETIEIKTYLKKDLILSKKLFEWYEEQFEPLKKLMKKEDQNKFKHLTASSASLAYSIICHKAGLKLEWGENVLVQCFECKNRLEINKEEFSKSDKICSECGGVLKKVTFDGGHHIESRDNKIKGNIVNIDFTSAYPHALIMGNLYSPKEEGWNGKPDLDIEGTYDNTKQGKVEIALKEILLTRLKAKREGDKLKAKSYKIVANSQYGLTGNPTFKSIYNPITASDCTHIVRTWLKKLSKIIEINGFKILYGFTDNIIIEIPDYLNEEILMMIVDKFIEDVKSYMPFPLDTFKMELETRMKFVWIVKKNSFLFVTDKNEVKYKSTLLNTNTPEVIMKVFNEYMKPKIIKELDVNFTEKELTDQILKLLEKNIELAAEEYKVGDLDSYETKTSIYYQISEVYGEGTHFLIPNKAMIGIGKSKGTKKIKPLRYCTIEEFNKNKLKIEDIEIKRLIQNLKPFFDKEQKQ